MPARSLSDIVLAAARDDRLAECLAAFYGATDQAIAGYGPVCRNRGLCCHFAEFGHKLYVTTAELAFFLRQAGGGARRPDAAGDDCPYHVAGRCEARLFRPLGCRVFFCDPDTREWQGPEYESRLIELKGIGDRHGVDYLYVEWLSALRELSEALGSKESAARED